MPLSINQSSLSSREITVFDMSTPFFTTHSRRRRHSLMLLSMKRCYSVIIALFSSSTVLNFRLL